MQPGFFQGLNKSIKNHCYYSFHRSICGCVCRANSLAQPDPAVHLEGVLPKSISVTAERGSVSRSTFNRSKTHGISCARSALRAAAGRRPALRSIWATRPQRCAPGPSRRSGSVAGCHIARTPACRQAGPAGWSERGCWMRVEGQAAGMPPATAGRMPAATDRWQYPNAPVQSRCRREFAPVNFELLARGPPAVSNQPTKTKPELCVAAAAHLDIVPGARVVPTRSSQGAIRASRTFQRVRRFLSAAAWDKPRSVIKATFV